MNRMHVATFGLIAACAAGAAVTQQDNAAPASPTWYEAEVAPILEARCTACHGAARDRGGLRLHTPDSIRAGGDNGSVLVVNDDPLSMLRRMQSPIDDLDHMPPEGKPQLEANELAVLTAWLEAGASFTAAAPAPKAVRPEAPPAPPIPAAAIRDLDAAHVHVEVIDPERNLVWIDFTAVPDLPVRQVTALLMPIAANTSDLTLRGMKTAGAALARSGEWPQLRRLDLTNAIVSQSGLAKAVASPQLTELRLINTTLEEGASDVLGRAAQLRRLHTWGTKLPDAVLAALRQRPDLRINGGDVTPPAALEVEPEFKYGRPEIETALPPVNEECPVTGSPVDRRFMIVHKDEVIGFCCPNCPKAFWDAPEQYTVKRSSPE